MTSPTTRELLRRPALGGEQIVRWHPQKTPIGTIVKPHTEGDFVRLEDHRAHIVPLMAEVERLNAELDAYKVSRERLHGWVREEQLKNIHLRARIAELEANTAKLNGVTPDEQ